MEGTIGEIRLFAATFAPRDWSYCDGSILAIRSNTALFAILGTTYGGDGRVTLGCLILLADQRLELVKDRDYLIMI
jgi:microcystin-dependent protein